jgi:hypothetical protein
VITAKEGSSSGCLSLPRSGLGRRPPTVFNVAQWKRLGGPETPENLGEAEQLATVGRDKFLHQTAARRPDALNPDNWAIDASVIDAPRQRRKTTGAFFCTTNAVAELGS